MDENETKKRKVADMCTTPRTSTCFAHLLQHVNPHLLVSSSKKRKQENSEENDEEKQEQEECHAIPQPFLPAPLLTYKQWTTVLFLSFSNPLFTKDLASLKPNKSEEEKDNSKNHVAYRTLLALDQHVDTFIDQYSDFGVEGPPDDDVYKDMCAAYYTLHSISDPRVTRVLAHLEARIQAAVCTYTLLNEVELANPQEERMPCDDLDAPTRYKKRMPEPANSIESFCLGYLQGLASLAFPSDASDETVSLGQHVLPDKPNAVANYLHHSNLQLSEMALSLERHLRFLLGRWETKQQDLVAKKEFKEPVEPDMYLQWVGITALTLLEWMREKWMIWSERVFEDDSHWQLARHALKVLIPLRRFENMFYYENDDLDEATYTDYFKHEDEDPRTKTKEVKEEESKLVPVHGLYPRLDVWYRARVFSRMMFAGIRVSGGEKEKDKEKALADAVSEGATEFRKAVASAVRFPK